ncbi:universal stress protein [bacterium]|nr:MAG: universal stress protein [bacterium]
MTHLSRVVAAVDLSEISPAVLSTAIRIARKLGCGVRLLHVSESLLGEEEKGPLLPALKKMVDEARSETERDFAALLSGASAEGIDIHGSVEEGQAAQKIIETARRCRAPYIVVGGPHPGGGSVAATLGRVLRSSTTPVLIVRKPPKHGYRKVLLGADISDEAPAVLAAAMQKICEPDANYTVLNIVSTGRFHHLFTNIDNLLAERRKKLAEWAAALNLPGAAVAVSAGDPKKKLLEEAQTLGADLLVVSSHATTELTELFLGSVARSAANKAPCDVLVCSPRGQKTSGLP